MLQVVPTWIPSAVQMDMSQDWEPFLRVLTEQNKFPRMLKCPTQMDTSSDLKVESNMIKKRTEAIPKSHKHMPSHSRLLKSEKCHETIGICGKCFQVPCSKPPQHKKRFKQIVITILTNTPQSRFANETSIRANATDVSLPLRKWHLMKLIVDSQNKPHLGSLVRIQQTSTNKHKDTQGLLVAKILPEKAGACPDLKMLDRVKTCK